MDTPLSAFASYKIMKPSPVSNFLKKKKKKRIQRKNESAKYALIDTNGTGTSDSEVGNGHISDDDKTTVDKSKSNKRKKKSKQVSNKKVKFQEVLESVCGLPPILEESGEHNDADQVFEEINETEELLEGDDESTNTFETVPSTSGNSSGDLSHKKSKNRKKQKKLEKKKAKFIQDSAVSGENVFKWIISPLSVEDFMSKTWEKQPICVSRKTPDYYSTLLSTPQIDQILRNNNILFGKNIDVTSYVDGERETHNGIGRAMPHVVWDFYENKCSIRFLNPQTYSRNLHSVNAMLQEYFGCFVGANAYLTPPNSQGFAPHFDDIEAFILQIEGQKKWKIYKPRLPCEELPRFSSRNLTEDELEAPLMEVTLKPGDLLYFPRGYIHQGCTVSDYHSLHITISVYQRNSFADLLEKVLPTALHTAIKTNVGFREGLPLNMINQFGFSHCDKNSEGRAQTIDHVKSLIHRIVDHIDLDAAVDSLALGFMHGALPPSLTVDELKHTVDSGLHMSQEGQVINRVQLEPSSCVKLIRRHCCRLVSVEGEPDEETGLRELETRLYYTLENSLEYHGNEPQFLVIPDSLGDLVKTLINSYPSFVKIEDIPHDNEDEKLQLLTDLWEKGLLCTEEPLVPISEDNE